MDFSVTVTADDDQPYAHGTARDAHDLVSDEPDWLPVGAGNDDHPAPVDYLLSSLAFCQASVLQQTLEANDVETYEINCEATLEEYGMRDDHPEELPHHTAGLVEHVDVSVELTTVAEFRETAEACLARFDEGCIVGNSLAAGVEHTTDAELTVDQ